VKIEAVGASCQPGLLYLLEMEGTESDYEFSFVDIDLERGPLLGTLEWIGEGLDGDYYEDDPNDEPLLRFSVYIRVDDPDAILANPEWPYEPITDTSNCTMLDAREDRELLTYALALMMDRVAGAFIADDEYDHGLKRTCEDLAGLTVGEVRKVKLQAEREAYARLPDAPDVGAIGPRERLSPLGD
jgi:hypothetical protein